MLRCDENSNENYEVNSMVHNILTDVVQSVWTTSDSAIELKINDADIDGMSKINLRTTKDFSNIEEIFARAPPSSPKQVDSSTETHEFELKVIKSESMAAGMKESLQNSSPDTALFKSLEPVDTDTSLNSGSFDILDLPIENVQLEQNIKQLIEDIRDLEKQNCLIIGGQGDQPLAEDAKTSVEPSVRENSLESAQDEQISLGNELTRKLCQTDLTNNQVADVYLCEKQEEWEECQEREIQIITPDYQSSCEDLLVAGHEQQTAFYNVDICGLAVDTTVTDDEDGAQKEEVFEDALVKSSPKCPIKNDYLTVNVTRRDSGNQTLHRRNKKKKWSLGSRILNFFFRQHRQTT